MGRVAGSGYNPLTALGDLIYGGAGTVTGYANRALASSGILLAYGGPPGAYAAPTADTAKAFDGNDATVYNIGGIGGNGQEWRVDLGAARRIGRVRVKMGSDVGNYGYPTDFTIDSSSDGAVWTTRKTVSGYVGVFAGGAHAPIDLPAPVSARYWRMVAVAGLWGGAPWWLWTFEIEEVTTVGAGNLTRLPPGAEGATLKIVNGVPAWV